MSCRMVLRVQERFPGRSRLWREADAAEVYGLVTR